MSKQFAEVKVFVAGMGDDDHLILSTDTLDGSKDMVTIRKGEDEKKEIIGYFDLDQLIDSLQVIKSANERMKFLAAKE